MTSGHGTSPTERADVLESRHHLAVALFSFLKEAGFELSPPDGEWEPDNFGVCSDDGELLYTVQVSEW